LIQEKSSAIDEHQVKERATELSSSLQLTEKQLFVFPQNEDHNNVALRLEGLLYEFSQQFYQNILRKIRSRSIPNNYSNLLIRQQFKLAFLSEMRGDSHSALRFDFNINVLSLSYYFIGSTNKPTKTVPKQTFPIPNFMSICRLFHC
jgi:hypothetical protein